MGEGSGGNAGALNFSSRLLALGRVQANLTLHLLNRSLCS